MSHKIDFVCLHLPTLVRLATDSPFREIRNHFSSFLEEIGPELLKHNIEIPKPCANASKFFRAEDIIPIDTIDPQISDIFKEAFLRTGRVGHLVRILAWHPSYYTHHKLIHKLIMGQSNSKFSVNPLSPLYCCCLAIMAAASFKCSYIVQEQEKEFVHLKGNPEWLRGLQFFPPKLKNLAEVNAILAHQPWMLKTEHVEKLLKGPDAWSLPDLVHAFIVLSSYRALAAFVWGMGINSEVDFTHKDLENIVTTTAPAFNENIELNTNTNNLLQKLCLASKDEGDEESDEKKVKLFEDVEKIVSTAENPTCLSTLERNGWSKDLELRYTDSYSTMQHSDFDVKSTIYKIFHIQEFSWGTHGFSMVKRYYPPGAKPLDDCFKCIRSLTYKSFGHRDSIETGPFRKAIWYYVHRVFGIFYDDYNYRNVNMLVPQTIKSVVKLMACTPWRVTGADLSNFGIELLPREKAHIALLVLEARKNSELLYALHAISKVNK